MKTRIACPHCGFTTEVSTDRIPEKARLAACPRCRNRFPLPEVRRPSPWEDRGRIGLWPGIYRSFLGVLLSPASFFRGLTPQGGLREPLALGLLFGSLGAMLSLFWDLVLGALGVGGGLDALASRYSITLVFPLLLVLSPVLVGVALFLTSGLLHVLLRVVRGGRHGFEGTFRVVAHGQAAQLFGAVPFLGGLIAGLWFLVVLIVGLREIHETTYTRVVLAFLLVAVLFLAVLAAVTIPLLMSLFR